MSKTIYKVIKTDKVYDPEGLYIPSEEQVVFVGSLEECDEKIGEIFDAQSSNYKGEKDVSVKLLSDRSALRYVEVYFFNAKALDIYQVVQGDHCFMQFDTLEEAREHFKENGFGEYHHKHADSLNAVVEIAGDKTLLAETDAFMDDVWNAMKDQLDFFGDSLRPQLVPNRDLIVEEASRLRDEFLKSVKKVYGLSYATVYEEF